MNDKPLILVVDDHIQNIELLEAILSPQGYEIVKASNGGEALGRLFDNRIDLILLDVMMPDIDGFEVLKRLRAKDSTFAIPVIMLTGIDSRDKVRQALDSGIDYYVTKPFEIGDLLAKVETILKNSPSPTDDNGIPGLF